jgi:hypothetical protein
MPRMPPNAGAMPWGLLKLTCGSAPETLTGRARGHTCATLNLKKAGFWGGRPTVLLLQWRYLILYDSGQGGPTLPSGT